MGWVQGLNSPRVAVRYGFAIQYDHPEKLTVRPPVIGDPPPPAGSNARARRGGGGGPTGPQSSPYDGVDNSTIPGFMYYYTGDFGDFLIEEWNTRRYKEAMFGSVLKDMPSINLRSVLPKQSPTRNRPNIPNDFREEDLAVDPSQANTSRDRDAVPQVYGTLQPGLMLVGTSPDRDQLVERARKIGLDVLFVVRVNVQVLRDGKGVSTVRLQAVTVADGKNQYSSRSLKHTDVHKQRERNSDRDRDPVFRLISEYFEEKGQEFSIAALPENAADMDDLKGQISAAIESAGDNPLPTAIQILNYRQLEWISDEAAADYLAELFDETTATALISGSAQEKQDAIMQWLPGQYTVDLSE